MRARSLLGSIGMARCGSVMVVLLFYSCSTREDVEDGW